MSKQRVKIVSSTDGKEIIETALLKRITEVSTIGHNKPTFVQFGEGDHREGYWKNSSKTSHSFFDKLEYIICQIGRKLGIKMATTYKVYDESGFCGIISQNVLNDNEQMYLASQLKGLIQEPSDRLKNYISECNIIFQEHLVEFVSANGNVWNIPVLDSEEDIEKILEAFPRVIIELEPNKEKQLKIISDYYQMIMLDLITNNVDRSNNNYGIIIDEFRNIRFTPLFDNSTIRIPGIPNNGRRIYGTIVDRDKLLRVLFKSHYEYIKSIAERCCDDREEILTSIRKICNQELSERDANEFLQTITNNILAISILVEQYRNGTIVEPTPENENIK